MTLEDRIRESEQKFEQYKTERDNYLQQAENCLSEMTKLQGEWRVLRELQEQEAHASEKAKANKKVTAIEAVPEEDK